MLKKLFTILSVCIFAISSGKVYAELEDYRLPNHSYPESYTVNLQFDHIDRILKYSGFVTIYIKILEDTSLITLHSAVHNVTKVTKIQEGSNVMLNYDLDEEKELLIIHEIDGDKFQNASFVTVKIEFEGIINEFPKIEGVYRGIYMDKNSTKQYFLATQVQPNNARNIFPCFDEPRFKSVFNLTIIHKTGYHAIFNTDKFEDTDLSDSLGIIIRSFKQTKSISTHMLGFVISNFKFEFVRDTERKYRIFSQPDQLDKTSYGFTTGNAALKSFEAYFNATYTSQRFDQVVLPQLGFDGIENHDINFYREDSFLFDEHADTFSKKEMIYRNVVNTICQTFIGSFVTQSWWSSVWLHKGICKFLEYHTSDSVMGLNSVFAVEVMQTEMSRDSSPSLMFNNESPSEIRSMFNSNSYNKAASVIRMFHFALSEATFKKGLQIYISKRTSNQEGIAEPKHFYQALQLAVIDTAENVAERFESWELQAGYPIVYVTRNFNGNNVKFSQKRFTDDINEGTDYNELWSIPITYSSRSNPNSQTTPKFWLNDPTEKIIDGLTTNDYFIVNIDQTGYYRVMYDLSNWKLIADALQEGNFANISPNTRAMLIDDAGTFVNKEMLDIRIFLDVVKYLKTETDYIPWLAATNNLLYVRRMLNDGNSDLYNDFQKFLQTLLTKVFETYGVQEKNASSHHQKHIRNLAINWACQARLPDCLNKTADLFQQSISGTKVAIPIDYRQTIMCNGVITGNAATYNFLWELYENSIESPEKSLYLKTIGCIEDRKILVEYIRSYEEVSDDEWFTVIQSVYLNGPIGLNVAMGFLKDENGKFAKFITDHQASSLLESMLHEIADRVITEEMFAEFTNLMVHYRLSSKATQSLNAIIKSNLKWIEKNSPLIDEFLNNSSVIVVSLTIILFGFLIQYFVG